MTAFRSLSWAMMVGFLRDKLALFFAILFPLMFLVLFGGIFSDQGLSKSTIIEVGIGGLQSNAITTAGPSPKSRNELPRKVGKCFASLMRRPFTGQRSARR